MNFIKAILLVTAVLTAMHMDYEDAQNHFAQLHTPTSVEAAHIPGRWPR